MYKGHHKALHATVYIECHMHAYIIVRRTVETVIKYYCTKQAPVFLAGVEISADTNFNRINVICDEDEQ